MHAINVSALSLLLCIPVHEDFILGHCSTLYLVCVVVHPVLQWNMLDASSQPTAMAIETDQGYFEGCEDSEWQYGLLEQSQPPGVSEC